MLGVRLQCAIVRYAVALLLLPVAACTESDPLVSPILSPVRVCRPTSGAVGTDVLIDVSQLDSALAAGGYVTELKVDPALPVTDNRNFRTLTAAVAAARAVRTAASEGETGKCRITIAAAPATLRGSTAASADPTLERFPIVIDVPDITIRGSTVLTFEASGRVTSAAATTPTILLPTVPLVLIGGSSSQTGVSEELFVINAHPDGSGGHRTRIEGFVLRSGHAPGDTTVGGQGILSMRVRDIVIRNNRFEGNFTERIDLRASSAEVTGNDLPAAPGATCDVCLAGPGAYKVRDNRVIGGGIPGILIVPTLLLPVPSVMEQYTLPASANVTVDVVNNEVGDHLRKPVGAGVRVAAVGVGAPNVTGDTRVNVSLNLIRNNTFGVIVEAGFPVNGSALRGDITFDAGGNTLQRSCQNDLLVSLSRHTTGLGLANQPYLRSSRFSLALGQEFSWTSAWFAHPAGLGNSLIVNELPAGTGTRVAYVADRVC